MIAEKESKITIHMSVDEARRISYCLARIYEKGDYVDVMPNNESTKIAVESYLELMRPLI